MMKCIKVLLLLLLLLSGYKSKASPLTAGSVAVTVGKSVPVGMVGLTLPPDSLYSYHQEISFNISFDGKVSVNPLLPPPSISLVVGTQRVEAVYVSGSGSKTLTFTYRVKRGDFDNDGISFYETTFENSANLSDDVGNPVNNMLPLVGILSGVKIDAVFPVVNAVWVPGDGLYNNGSQLTFTVLYNKTINLAPGPQPLLELVIGNTTRKVPLNNFDGLNGILVFSYIVQSDDLDLDGIALGAQLDFNGAVLTDQVGNPLDPQLNNASPTTHINVNGNRPSVVITAPTNIVSQSFTATITFSEPVTGFPSLTLSGCTVSNMQRVDQSVFTVEVNPAGSSGTMQVPENVTLNAVGNRNTASNVFGFSYDNTAPLITNVTVPSDKTYKQGEVLSFTINYSEDIVLNNTGGNPSLDLILASGAKTAMLAGSGPNYLTFNYTVSQGDLDLSGLSQLAGIVLNGAAIRDLAGNNASNTLQNVGSLTHVLVDGNPPVVTAVSVPSDGYYKAGSTLNFGASVSEGVLLDVANGTPSLDITIGSTTRKALFTGAVGNTLNFSYTIQPDEVDLDGIAVGGAISMNGGTVRDAAGNDLLPVLHNVGSTANVFVNAVIPTVKLSTTVVSPLNQPFTVKITFSEAVTGFVAGDINVGNATLSNFVPTDNLTYTVLVTPLATGAVTLSIPADAAFNSGNNGNAASTLFSVNYDITPPGITNVTAPADKIYKKNEVLSFNVYYNENIVADTSHGVPSISLVLASGNHNVPLTAIGTNYVTFSYTVQSGDEDLSGPALGANMTLNGGTIRDAVGNDALSTLQNVASLRNVFVDAKSPVVTSVAVPTDGYYHTGDPLNFTVHFSENAVATGTPSIDVTIGGTVQKAYYTSGSGTSQLVFRYQVQNGEMDMDGIALGAMQLNNGTIQDVAGNDAVLTLNSVGSTSGVFVNTQTTTVTLSTAATSPLNQPFTAKIVFSEAVTGFIAGDIIAGNATLSDFATADNITYTVLVTPTAAGAVTLSIPANVAVNIGNNGNAASTPLTVIYDPAAPTITNVTVPANKTYKKNEVLSFSVYYNENILADTSHGVPSISLLLASGIHNVPLTAIGANYVTFSYTVQTGDEDLTGPALGANMHLNNGTIRDAAGNNATLILQNVASLRNVWVDAKAPVVTSVAVPNDGYYHTGDPLNFTVHFSENAVATGTPSIDVTIGGTVQKAYYTSGSGSSQLVFRYQVQNGEMDMDGIALGAMQLNNGTIQDVAGNDAVLTLNSVGSTSGIFVNTQTTTVTLSTAATSPLNQPFTAKIVFSEAVTGFIAGDIIAGNATLSDFATADNITYTVLVTPTAAGAVTLSIPANVAVNIGNNGNAASTPLTVIYDPAAPSITNVIVPANKTYKKNEVLSFNVYYNENILADTSHGVPSISLLLASGIHNVPLTAIGANYVTFSYTVQTGDEDLTGPALGANMHLNNGTIRDAAGNNATLILQNVASLRNVWVDAKAPVVNSVGVPADGYYKEGQPLDFTVNVSENVLVTSQPTIDLIIGNTTRHATYISGSGSKALVFRYIVQRGDLDMDGISVAGQAVMNGGAIRDMADNDLAPALNSIGNTSQVFVNTVIPSVLLSSTAVSPLNTPFTATITFSEKITGFVAGSITGTNATFSNLKTTDNITYTVLVTPAADGAVTVQVPASVAVNVGGNGNTASNILHFIYDHTAPFVTGVTLPSDGYYKAGTTLDFAVQVSENVSVTMATGGKSYLTLSIGTGIEQAYFTGITGNNVLHYRYTVKTGDMDLDGIAVAPDLSLNGTLIRDAAGNDLLLPLHNMGSTAGIFVNTAHPSVVLSTTVAGRINTTFPVTLRFSEAISGLTIAAVQVKNGTASNLQKKDPLTYTVDITPAADGAVSIILPAGVVVNIGGNDNTTSNMITVNYDATAPVIPAGLVFTVKQNSPVGTIVGTLTATDAIGTIQNWTIAADNSGGAFALDANGNITVKDVAQLNRHAGTTVTLRVTVSDGLNTAAPVDVAINIVFVNKAPTLGAISNVNICATGEVYTIQLTGASATEPQQTYTYNVSSSADVFDELTVTNKDVLRYKLKNSFNRGQITINVTIKDNGGTDNGGIDTLRRTFTISVYSLPVVNISSNIGTTISKGDIAALTATGGNHYRWMNADGIVSGDRTPVLQVRPMVKTTYTVLVTNADGCSSSGEMSIDVKEDFKVDATNILTPNGDGKNDKWVIRNIDSYPDNEVKIFDRAGRMVYQRRNYSNDWQGTLNGNPLAEGTYYYILTIQNGAKTTKGFITIVRDK